MILNVDRRRLYIISCLGVFLLLMLILYHAPAYVPAEVSRMKTSVSTWLKGTEPSLNDEMYKDSPHISSTTRPQNSKTEEEVQDDPYEIKPAVEEEDFAYSHPSTNDELLHTPPPKELDDEMLHALPISTDERPDVLPPLAASATVAAATQSAAPLPASDDFVNILPPVNVLSLVPTPSPAPAEPSESVTHHRHLEEMSMPEDFEATTFITHVSSAASNAVVPTSEATPTSVSEAIPSVVREAFGDDEWFLEHSGHGRT